jgi:hypothetical protein
METNKQPRTAMPEDIKDKAVAFITGDLTVMGFTFIRIPDELINLWWKVLITIVVGIAGGIAGMVGKDLYTLVKSKLFKSKP